MNHRWRCDDVRELICWEFTFFLVHLRCDELPASQIERDRLKGMNKNNHLALLFAF